MTLYRLYTEDKGNLAQLVTRYFEGFTILKGTGYWKGTAEPSAIIEVLTSDAESVRSLATLIRRYNTQETVYITRTEVSLEVVSEA